MTIRMISLKASIQDQTKVILNYSLSIDEQLYDSKENLLDNKLLENKENSKNLKVKPGFSVNQISQVSIYLAEELPNETFINTKSKVVSIWDNKITKPWYSYFFSFDSKNPMVYKFNNHICNFDPKGTQITSLTSNCHNKKYYEKCSIYIYIIKPKKELVNEKSITVNRLKYTREDVLEAMKYYDFSVFRSYPLLLKIK